MAIKQTVDRVTKANVVMGYAPGVPGARTAAERMNQMRAGQAVSAYTGTPETYRGGSHKIGGVEVVPGAPGYDAAKALPLVKELIAPYSKDVQSYLKDIGQMDAETEAAIQKVQREDEYRTGLAQMVSKGELTGPRAEAAMIDYNRGKPRADIETAVAEAQKEASTLEKQKADLAQRESELAAQEAARRRARMRRNRPLLSEERLAPELQL